MVYYEKSSFKLNSKNEFNKFFDGVLDGFAGNEVINTPTVSQKETKQKDELYVGDAKIKADIKGAEREVMIHVVFDRISDSIKVR